MLKPLIAGIGGLFVLVGFVMFWTPLPLGVPMVLIGLPLVTRNSPRMSRWIKHHARHFPRFAAILDRLDRD